MQGRESTFGDGRYVVRRELGRGTMGVVYEAEDGMLARTVAVKTIDLTFAAGQAASREFEQRFFREARVAAQLSHPGIVVCHDVGKDADSGKLFIVFERLKGRTLQERAGEGPMEWRQALALIVQVARAIHHAHEHGVVHRDLKPANIMVLDPATSGASAAGTEAAVKIMDFGVARIESLGRRLTRTGQAFGSPLYMSPEQALGQASSARSDIFSLGSVLCTLLLGRPWFDAPSLPKIVDRVVHDDPPRVSKLRTGTPASLDAVVAMALAKSEEDRYRSAAHMADDLEDVLAGRPPKHAAPGPSGRAAADDALLAGLSAPARSPRALPAQDPLASLLDEPRPPAPLPAGGATTIVMTGSRRRWVAPAAAALVLALLAAGAAVWWRRSPVHDAAPPTPTLPSVATPGAVVATPAAIAETPAAIAETTPAPTETTTTVPAPPSTTTDAAAPTTSLAIVPTTPARPVASSAPAVRSTPVAATVEPPAASPAASATEAGEEVPAPLSVDPAQSRIRLSVEHPFESGRLIVWIDGVLVHETKLQAPVSRKVIGIKVREGRADKLLDVEPGPHEVRVEVTWGQNRRAGSKVVDVASGSTGLLEVRVGRVSKDLSLSWSRLARD